MLALPSGAQSTESQPSITSLAPAISVAPTTSSTPGTHARVRTQRIDAPQLASARTVRGGVQTQLSGGRAHKLSASGASKGEAAAQQLLQQGQGALQTAESLRQESALAGRHRGGGRGTQGKGGGRGKHRGAGEPPAVGQAPAATAIGGAQAKAAAVAAAIGVSATPAVSATSTPQAAGPLVPRLASVASQPPGSVSRSSRGTASSSRRGAGRAVSTFAPARVAAAPTAEAGTAPATVKNARTASTAAAADTGDTLERIAGQIPLPIPVPDWSKPVIVALLLLALALAVRARRAGARARRLERESAGLLRDLGAMQAALVPEVPAQVGGLDVSVAYRPAEGPAAGGDFYDLFIPRPGVVAMMLGDVSGHGHDALTHAALARYTLRAYLQAGLEPRMALALAGRVLTDPTGAQYATVAVGIYDGAAGTLTYSLAGHPPPMFIGAPGVDPVTACSSPPVGWSVPTGRRQTTVSLPRDSEVCFFSDGLVEARKDGELLGRDHLRQLLAGLGSHPQAEELLEEVRRAAPATPDDMVACILSAPGGPSAPSVHVEELEVDAHALQSSAVRRFLCECKVPPRQLGSALRRASELVASTGGALLRIEVAASSSVHVLGAHPTAGGITAARGTAAREEPALAALAAAS